MDLSAQICINNIYHLAKEKNIKIGDLEKDVGVSSGYFSRQLKREKDIYPSIEVLLACSDILKVSLETLLKVDLTVTDSNTSYFIEFIDKLIRITNENSNKKWEGYPTQHMSCCIEEGKKPPHPLLQQTDNIIDVYKEEKGHTVFIHELKFISSFNPTCNYELIGSIFSFKLSDTHTLYLAQILSKEACGAGFECYLFDETGHKNSVCNGMFGENVPLYHKLEELYETAKLSSKKIVIQDTVKSVLDDFMSNNE